MNNSETLTHQMLLYKQLIQLENEVERTNKGRDEIHPDKEQRVDHECGSRF